MTMVFGVRRRKPDSGALFRPCFGEGCLVKSFKVEIDDGTGNISWLDIEADNSDGAADAACRMLAEQDSSLDPELMVVITVLPKDG